MVQEKTQKEGTWVNHAKKLRKMVKETRKRVKWRIPKDDQSRTGKYPKAGKHQNVKRQTLTRFQK